MDGCGRYVWRFLLQWSSLLRECHVFRAITNNRALTQQKRTKDSAAKPEKLIKLSERFRTLIALFR